MTNLVRRLSADVGLQVGVHQIQDPVYDIQDRNLHLVREVERFAGEGRRGPEPFREEHVGGSPIFDIEVIPNELAV